MDRTPPPVSLAAALALPRTLGRSSEVFVDGDLEVKFAARPTNGPQVPHQRDELYFVAAGSGHYRRPRCAETPRPARRQHPQAGQRPQSQ
jgi:hypothetical protein